MQLVALSSRNISSAGYDGTSQTLRVSFQSGGLYDYHSVPEHHYHGLISASSHGGYLDTYIKKGGYRFTKLR